MKMWAGRFSKEVDSRVNDFNSSIAFDARLYREDIEGSMAHARMLTECGIISPSDGEQIIEGLKAILADVEEGTISFSPDAEDIHMNVEALLTERIGDAGKRLHTARSRNDQVALDMRMHLKKQSASLIGLINELVLALCDKAEENLTAVMPGYTHLQRAQPVTFAHHLSAYIQMLLRDMGRLQDAGDRMDELPLGAGALASTTYPIERERTAQLLGFSRVCENSMDAVSDRDFCLELLSALSILMVHLSRFSEEIILWCSHEFKFIELDDAFATGSSIMPQKKNPDVAELIRGKSGRVFGSLMGLLTVMKGLPLAYNKDMQEDKEAVFDALDTVKLCLTTFTPMISTMKTLPENMRKAAAGGFINATDCADYLVSKGLPFRDAYKITGQLVALCIEKNETLESLSLADYKELSPLFSADVYGAVSLETCLEGRRVRGGPAPDEVKRQLEVSRRRAAHYGGAQ